MDLPRVRCSRVSWSVSTCSLAHEAAQLLEQLVGQRLGQAHRGGIDGRGLGGAQEGVDQAERALRTAGAASAGSPQRDQCISGVDGFMCYSVTHDVHSSQDPGARSAERRLPRRRPRGDPRRRLEPYDADRHRPSRRGEPDDALPPLARHADAAGRPDDPRVGRAVGDDRLTGVGRTGADDASSRISRRRRRDRPRRCAPTRCCAGSSTSTPSCCCPTCSTVADAARTMSPTRSPPLIGEGQRDGSVRARRPDAPWPASLCSPATASRSRPTR